MIPHFFAEALISGAEVGVPQASAPSLQGILNTVYFWAGALAVVYIVVAAFRLVTSNGDASQVSQARRGIIAALVGLVLIFSAFIITQFVLGGF